MWLAAIVASQKASCELLSLSSGRQTTSVYKVTGYSSSQHASPLLELTCHMGSQCYLPPGRGDIPATQANSASYVRWTGNEYRPKCGDAVWLGSKSQAWLIPCEDERVWGAGKTVWSGIYR